MIRGAGARSKVQGTLFARWTLGFGLWALDYILFVINSIYQVWYLRVNMRLSTPRRVCYNYATFDVRNDGRLPGGRRWTMGQGKCPAYPYRPSSIVYRLSSIVCHLSPWGLSLWTIRTWSRVTTTMTS